MNKSKIRIIVYKLGYPINIKPDSISISNLSNEIADKRKTKVLII